MLDFKRPMLAAPLLPPDVEHTNEIVLKAMEKLKYPVMATLKMDGIRAIKLDCLRSRTLKPIPNLSIQARSMKLPPGFDMELWSPELEYCDVESIVMSERHADSDKIQFHLLDYFDQFKPYNVRVRELSELICLHVWSDCVFKSPLICNTAEDLFEFERQCIEQAGEGICFRTLNSPYKQGRSTLREQYLVKLSRYVRSECVIIGFEEQQHNTNRSKVSLLGLTERSSHQHNKIGKGTLGAFIIKWGEHTLTVGTGVGLTDSIRDRIWDNQPLYMGKTITIKHKPCGQKIKPRHPVFVGFREVGF